jgi:hypothetical protein
MRYNTQMKKLTLPEYGRNIQNMVDHCVAVKDPKERKKCAYTVIDVMGSMFPHLRDVNNFKHILWDHLAIMSDFKLDIDYPYEVITRDELNTPPGRLDYSRPTMQYRHYGKIMEKMIMIAAKMEDGDKKEHMIKMLLGQMKRSYTQWNKEVSDQKICLDLQLLSDCKIMLDTGKYVIPAVKPNPVGKDKMKNIKHQRKK